MGHRKFAQDRLLTDIIKIKVRFGGSAEGQMGMRWHRTSRRIEIFERNKE
jgi:hypothetical protein